MPELPEVETTKNELKLIIINKYIDKILIFTDSLRFQLNKKNLKKIEKSKIIKVIRKGKYILIFFLNNYILLIHLGMSGRLIFKKEIFNKTKHDHIVLRIKKNFNIIFNDPRKFGIVDVIKKDLLLNSRYLKKLGVDALSKEFSYKYFENVLINRKTNIKNILLNQSLISGLGNIYVCESLFEAGISPFKLANSLNKKNIKILKNKIQKVLKKAIKLKGSSINDYKTPMGTLGSFQNNFKVYNREGKSCKNIYCGKKIIRTIISGRSAYFCKNCQKN